MFKKRSFLLIVMVVLALFIAGCGDKEATSDSEDSSEEKILSLAMPAIAASNDIKKLIPQFEEQTGIKIEWNEFDYNTHYERVLNDMQTGQGTYDVVLMNNIYVPMFAGGGFLANLEELGYDAEYLNDNFAEASINLGLWPEVSGQRLPGADIKEDPQLYAIPQHGNVQLFTWRKDIIGDEPPQTWDEVKELLEKYKGETEYGFVILGASGTPVTGDFSSFHWSFGVEMFDENWQPMMKSKENIEALELFVELSETGPPGSSNYNSDELVRTMAQGSALMSLIWAPQIVGIEDEGSSVVAGKMGYAAPPSNVAGDHYSNTGHWLLGIPEASSKKEMALEFLNWASSYDVQKQIAMNVGVPALLDVFKDEEVIKKTPWLAAVYDGLNSMNSHPKTPLYREVENVYGSYLNLAVAGELPPEEALNKAYDEVYDIFDSNGYYE